MQAVRGSEGDNFFLERLQQCETHVEEVAGAAGRVENAYIGEARLEVRQDGAEFVAHLLALAPLRFQPVKIWLRLLLGTLPLRAERAHENRFDYELDVLPGGVVSAELLALAGVDHTLKESSEYGRFYIRPVEAVEPLEHGYLVGYQARDECVVEQTTVEVGHLSHQKAAAVLHCAEELGEILTERVRVCLVDGYEVFEHLLRKQANVAGEEAEDHPHDIPGYLLIGYGGVADLVPSPKVLNEGYQQLGRFFGESRLGLARVQGFRIPKQRSESLNRGQ